MFLQCQGMFCICISCIHSNKFRYCYDYRFPHDNQTPEDCGEMRTWRPTWGCRLEAAGIPSEKKKTSPVSLEENTAFNVFLLKTFGSSSQPSIVNRTEPERYYQYNEDQWLTSISKNVLY